VGVSSPVEVTLQERERGLDQLADDGVGAANGDDQLTGREQAGDGLGPCLRDDRVGTGWTGVQAKQSGPAPMPILPNRAAGSTMLGSAGRHRLGYLRCPRWSIRSG
jgi:hypothetical protein